MSLAHAALEWQARSWGGEAQILMAACPLEGLVRSVAFLEESNAVSSYGG